MTLPFLRADVLLCLMSFSILFVPQDAVAEDSLEQPNMVAFANVPANNASGPNWSENAVTFVSCITPAPAACESCTPSKACACQSRCGGGCNNACGGCGNACCGKFSLGDLLTPSAPCFQDFISPVTNPVFFEDPRTLTEARAIFMHNNIPLSAFDGDAQVFGLQLRAALSDRLSFVAAKSGFITSSHPLIDDGWADLAAGLKYNLLADAHRQRLLSAGVSYELPVGSTTARQGNGDGEFNLYMTGGAQLGQFCHWISAAGLRLPTDTVDESQVSYWSNHLDCRLLGSLYGLVEVNWFHWLKSGQNGVPGVEGLDLFNLGSTGVAGNDIVTGALGFRYKVSDHVIPGIAWEFPLTDRRDIIDNRWTIDLILRY